MNCQEAQQKLACTVISACENVQPFFWKLCGDGPECFCHFLGVTCEDLKKLMHLCGVLHGEKDRLSTGNFEMFLTRIGSDISDCSACKHLGKREKCIKLGKGKDAAKPQNMCNSKGELIVEPKLGEHFNPLRAKSQRLNIESLLEATGKPMTKSPSPAKSVRRGEQDLSPGGSLISETERLVEDASGPAKKKPSNPTRRMLSRLTRAATQTEAKDWLRIALEKVAINNGFVSEQEEVATPDRATSTVEIMQGPRREGAAETKVIAPTALSMEVDGVETEEEQKAEEESVANELTEESKEEALLQTLLHKRTHERKERAFELEHRNGRRMLVALPPESRSVSTFQDCAAKAGWINALLNTEEKQEGMLLCLAKEFPDMFESIGKRKRLIKSEVHLSTAQTLALAQAANLSTTRLNKLRSCLRHVAGANLKLNRTALQEMDNEVGMERTMQDATFGECTHEWSLTKGGETKSEEAVDHWHSSLGSEVEAEADVLIAAGFCKKTQSKGLDDCMPTLDCPSKGFDAPGVVVLFGGDHGDKNCPINCKLSLRSPSARKQAGKLGLNCPIAQFASVRRSKDACHPLGNTVMPAVAKEVSKAQQSCVATVCSKDEPDEGHRSHMMPKTIGAVAFSKKDDTTIIACNHSGGMFGSLTLDRRQFDMPTEKLGHKRATSNFHDLHIGDLAFQAMPIGMNNSDGDWCLLCDEIGSSFNNGEDGELRTAEALEKHLPKCKETHEEKKAKGNECLPANHRGVDSKGLVNIDPQNTLTPLSHCPMGLVDKTLESFLNCIACEVERLGEEATMKRKEFWTADKAHEEAKSLLKQAKHLSKAHNAPTCKKPVSDAGRARIDASSKRTAAKSDLDELLKRHNATEASLKQRFEKVHKDGGVTREHCHGGKFSGVNCTRTMEKAKTLFDGFAEVSTTKKIDSIAPEDTRKKCSQHERLLGAMDAMWSSARGIDSGSLPTDGQTDALEKSLKEGKILWLVLGLSTLQLKWHLAFEGHLLQQVRKFGGPADKSDESMEAFHQDSKALRDRFRGTQSHKQKEAAIRRELRRKRNPKAMSHIEDCLEKSKLGEGNKRTIQAQERKENKKKVKMEKRSGCVDNDQPQATASLSTMCLSADVHGQLLRAAV